MGFRRGKTPLVQPCPGAQLAVGTAWVLKAAVPLVLVLPVTFPAMSATLFGRR